MNLRLKRGSRSSKRIQISRHHLLNGMNLYLRSLTMINDNEEIEDFHFYAATDDDGAFIQLNIKESS